MKRLALGLPVMRSPEASKMQTPSISLMPTAPEVGWGKGGLGKGRWVALGGPRAKAKGGGSERR